MCTLTPLPGGAWIRGGGIISLSSSSSSSPTTTGVEVTSSVCEGLWLDTWLGRWLSDDSTVVESRSDPLSKLGVLEEMVREEEPPLLPLLPPPLLLEVLGYSVLVSVSVPQLPTSGSE